MSSAKYLQLAQQFTQKYTRANNFMHISKSVRPVSAEEGKVRIEFEVTEEMTNPNKTLHGGCTATLIDIWTTVATMLTSRGPINTVSISFNVDFMAPAKIGETVILDSKVLRMGRTKAYTEAALLRKSDNKIVAKGLHVKEIIGEKAP